MVVKLSAMPDGEETVYNCMGALCPIENEPSRPVLLTKRITVYNLGSYTKQLTTPMYSDRVMRDLSVQSAQHRFDPAGCMGVLCGSVSCKPCGYVTRTSGVHRFCLPVYSKDSISGSFYRVAGYMVTPEGYFAVAKRRVMLWVILALLCGVAVTLSYLIYTFGANGAWNELVRLFQELF